MAVSHGSAEGMFARDCTPHLPAQGQKINFLLTPVQYSRSNTTHIPKIHTLFRTKPSIVLPSLFRKDLSETVYTAGADPGFFLGEGALVSCSTSTPINHIVFFFSQNTSCIRKPQVISRGGGGVRTPCTLSLDPPLHCLGQRGRKLNPVQRHILV